jgi:hypothetical protein
MSSTRSRSSSTTRTFFRRAISHLFVRREGEGKRIVLTLRSGLVRVKVNGGGGEKFCATLVKGRDWG